MALSGVVTKIGPAIKMIFAGGLTAGGFGAIAAAIIAIGGALTLVAGAAGRAKQALSFDEARESIESVRAEYEKNSAEVTRLRDEYMELSSQSNLTAAQEAQLESVLQRIAQLSPELRGQIMDTTGAWREQTDVVEALNGELLRLTDNQNQQLRLGAVMLFGAASGEVEDLNAQMHAIREIDRLLSEAADAQKSVWDYVNSLGDNGNAKRILTSGLEALAGDMQIDIPFMHFWDESDVDAALHRYSLLANSLFTQMEGDTKVRIEEMKSSLMAFVMQDGFALLDAPVQEYLTRAASEMINSIDWNIADQGFGKELMGKQLEALFYNTVSQLEQLQPMIDRLDELARTDTALLPEPELDAWTQEVNE